MFPRGMEYMDLIHHPNGPCSDQVDILKKQRVNIYRLNMFDLIENTEHNFS